MRIRDNLSDAHNFIYASPYARLSIYPAVTMPKVQTVRGKYLGPSGTPPSHKPNFEPLTCLHFLPPHPFPHQIMFFEIAKKCGLRCSF